MAASEPDTVEFVGERFRIADSVGLMPMMRFAKVAKDGVDSNTLEGLAAMYDLLRQCIAEDEWARFEKHADDTHADGDVLMQVVSDTFEVLSGRPTSRPSDSSDGPTTTARKSTSRHAERAIARERASGRPDRGLALAKAQEAQTA